MINNKMINDNMINNKMCSPSYSTGGREEEMNFKVSE